jgi:hypothetical protein
MRQFCIGLAALGLAACGAARADVSPHFVGTAGLSYGGDTVATVQYTNGNSTDIKAGGLYYIGGGLSLEFTGTPWSVQGLLGYHADSATASNGDVSFKRTTFDGQAFYRFGNNRIGLGLVRHMSPQYKANIDYQPPVTVDFNTATGVSLEYNWLPPGSKFGLSVRAVHISYDASSVNGVPVSNSDSLSGDHVAVGAYLYL